MNHLGPEQPVPLIIAKAGPLCGPRLGGCAASGLNKLLCPVMTHKVFQPGFCFRPDTPVTAKSGNYLRIADRRLAKVRGPHARLGQKSLYLGEKIRVMFVVHAAKNILFSGYVKRPL